MNTFNDLKLLYPTLRMGGADKKGLRCLYNGTRQLTEPMPLNEAQEMFERLRKIKKVKPNA